MPQQYPSLARWSMMIGAAVLVAACSESTTTPSRRLSPSITNADQWPELNSPSAQRHVMHIKGWVDNDGNANGLDNGNAAGNSHGRPGGGNTSNGISYHNGPVLLNGPKVAAVYWASGQIFTNGPTPGTHGDVSQDNSNVGYFLKHLGGSSYFNINTTYTNGSGTAIANAVAYTQFWANNSFNVPANGSSPSDANMLAMLQNGFATGNLTYDANTVYAIFTPAGVNLGGGFGTQYCAYHWYGTVTVNGAAKTVLYAAMPYNYAFPSACTAGSAPPNNDPGADYEVNTLAHEVEEATTDPLGTAWYDNRGYENADKCAWTFGTTASNGTGVYNITVGAKQFLVQQNWVNASGGFCATGR